jgi:large subunit ribosomal protein L29
MNRADMYHNMTTAELKTQLASLKQELFNLRFQHSSGQLKNPLQLHTVKKDIARAMTILNERNARGVPDGSAAQKEKAESAPEAKATKAKKSEGVK